MRKYRIFFKCGGVICKLPKFSNKLVTADQSSGIHIGLKKVLQVLKINHGHDFVKLA